MNATTAAFILLLLCHESRSSVRVRPHPDLLAVTMQ